MVGTRDVSPNEQLFEQLLGRNDRFFPRAFMRRVVQEHRGRVWLESGNGRGTVFYVELPTAEVRA